MTDDEKAVLWWKQLTRQERKDWKDHVHCLHLANGIDAPATNAELIEAAYECDNA